MKFNRRKKNAQCAISENKINECYSCLTAFQFRMINDYAEFVDELETKERVIHPLDIFNENVKS